MRFLKTLILFVAVAIAAFGQNPHFIQASAALQTDGSLVVSFKEAGLGDTVTVLEQASANATASYACVNGGGNHPQAANKETVHGPVSASGNFTSGKNGNIVGSLTIAPLGPGTFSCPNGQQLVLAAVSYSGIAITDVTSNVTRPISGTFSVVFFPNLL